MDLSSPERGRERGKNGLRKMKLDGYLLKCDRAPQSVLFMT